MFVVDQAVVVAVVGGVGVHGNIVAVLEPISIKPSLKQSLLIVGQALGRVIHRTWQIDGNPITACLLVGMPGL